LRLPTQESSRQHSDRLELPASDIFLPGCDQKLEFQEVGDAVIRRATQSEMVTRPEFCRRLAKRMYRCWLQRESLVVQRMEKILDVRAPWIVELSQSLVRDYGPVGYASRRELGPWFAEQPTIKAYFKGRKRRLWPTPRDLATATGRLTTYNGGWQVPQLDSIVELCRLLELPSLRELDWLILPHVRRDTGVEHYRRIQMPKKRAGEFRWIEEPLPKLKAAQRRLLDAIVPYIPLHSAAHAYRSGYSAKTCSAEHVGKRVILSMDLVDFFGAIPVRRVRALFQNAGYSFSIAQILAQLCTAPANLDETQVGSQGLNRTRLPQGAPTSPALANAIAYRLDRRLAGLAHSSGATYTRYADDLLFSGGTEFASRCQRFATSVAAIVIEEGFSVQFHKTRLQFSGAEQRVLGITVNEKQNINRREYESLKAELHNCVHQGWQSQNLKMLVDYRGHLRGRIAHIHSLNAARGKKLLQRFEQVDWEQKR
jgi:RNA-directed DNA polymerase